MRETDACDKDDSIIEALAVLESKLGQDGFQIEDHWEGDRCAIGIAKPGNLSTLVYISTYEQPAGIVSFECEISSEDEDVPYVVTRSCGSCTSSELVDVVAKHFGLTK